MSQDIFSNINPATTSGTQLATLLNGFKDAVASGFSGTSRPPNLQAGGYWIDTTGAPNSWAYKVWTGAVDITVFTLNLITGAASITGSDSTFQILKTSADDVGPILRLVKARIAGGGQVLSGDIVGEIQFKGTDDASATPIVCRIKSVATDNMTASASGAYLIFETTVDGTAALAEAMRLVDGKLGIGTTTPEDTIHARGTGIRVEKRSDDAVGVKINAKKTRIAGSGQVLSGDVISEYHSISVDDTGADVDAFKMVSTATENHTTTAHGNKLEFYLKKIGEVAFTKMLEIGEFITASAAVLFSSKITLQGKMVLDQHVNSTLTGALQTLPDHEKTIVKVTHASLVSIEMVDYSTQEDIQLILINGTGVAITLKNLTGATPAKQIRTGTGADLTLENGASVILAYDLDGQKWQVVGGSGSGGGVLTANRAVATNGAGALVASSVTDTELGYLSGVTSAIQTQFGGKEPTITAGSAAQYYRGDKTMQTLDSAAVAETSTKRFFATDRQAGTSVASPYTVTDVAATMIVLNPASDITASASVLSNGSRSGQRATIVNKNATYSVELITAGNMKLVSAAILYQYRTITFEWDHTDSLWYEVGRN